MNTRLLFFAVVLFTLQLNAQIFGSKSNDIPSYKVGMLSFSGLAPIPVGDNFVSNGAKTSIGGELNFKLNVYRTFYMGIRLNLFGFDIENSEFSGNYDRSNVASASPLLGYRFYDKNKLGISANIGIGYVNYRNKRDHIKFNEDGTTYWISLEAEYAFSKYFQAFVAPELRYDNLSIVAPSQVSKSLNNIYYLNVNLGMRFTFWNNEEDSFE